MAGADVTTLLARWSSGDRLALEELTPLVYEELRKLARGYFRREKPGHTLQGTALVHEAYVKLIGQNQVEWQNRAHFFAVAAQMVRRLLVDHARASRAHKRGGGAPVLSLDDALGVPGGNSLDILRLEDALEALGQMDQQQARIVELRFFAGLTIEETAETLGISPATVKRDWVTAKAWLFRELNRAGAAS